MLRLFTCALAALMFLSTAASAATLSYRLAFPAPELVQGGTGAFSILVTGLQDNTANQRATSVIIESFTFGDGTAGDLSLLSQGTDATTWTNQSANVFTVSAGALTSYFFQVNSVIGGTGTTQDSLNFIKDAGSDSFQLRINQENGYDFNAGDISGSRQPTITLVSAVPLPAPAFLLLAALGGLALMARRRRAAPAHA